MESGLTHASVRSCAMLTAPFAARTVMNAPQQSPPVNPYAAPTAMAPDVAAAEKRRRVNLINRRSTAVIVELAIWTATGGLLLQILQHFARPVPPLVFSALGYLYYALRDVIGIPKLTRKWVGLRLVDGSDAAGT